ncbi:MAG: hypothetical protein ABIR96_11515 [Bdellovibrionota bacterium]
MKVAAALDISKETTLREYGAKLVFALVTLAFLWSSGGSDGQIFWSRQPALFVVTLVTVLAWARLMSPTIWAAIIGKPTSDELIFALKWGTGCALLAGGILTVAVLLIPNSPWVSWDFLKTYSVTQGLVGLPFVLASSYVIEFFMRGYLSDSWGKGSVAFLESVTIAVGLQHFLPFAFLLPLIFVCLRLTKTKNLRAAALTRVVCTLLVILFASLVTSRSA